MIGRRQEAVLAQVAIVQVVAAQKQVPQVPEAIPQKGKYLER